MRQIMLGLILLWPTLAHAFTTDSQEDICAQSWVIMCDNFENRALFDASTSLNVAEFKNGGWGSGAAGGWIETAEHMDGTKSWKLTFPDGTGQPSPEARSATGGSTFYLNSQRYSELWIREYVKHSSNFKWSVVANKYNMHLATHINGDQTLYFETGDGVGGSHLYAQPWFYETFGGGNQFQNTGTPFQFQPGVWYCTEFHIKLNTAGQSNGTVEGWVDGNKIFNYVGVANIDPDAAPWYGFKIDGFWNCAGNDSPACVTADSNHPVMYRWHDNIVVGTQRIGCLGSVPPPDTNPPATPTGVMVTMLAATMIFGGLYGHLTANRVSQHRLALGHAHADSTTLRTVAVHGSASGADAMYRVDVANRAGTAEAAVLAPPAPAATPGSATEAGD